MTKKAWIMPLSYIALASIIILFVLTHSPIVGYDTESYVNFVSKRPPLYPIFIWLFKWCGKYQFEAVTWAKTIIYGISLIYARSWLRKHLKISEFLIFLVFCAATVTTFRMVLLAESLTVPLFIVAFFTAVDAMNQFQFKKIIYLSIWVSLLVLARNQLCYFYIFFLWLIFWYFWIKIPRLKIAIAAIILFASIISTSLISNLYFNVIHAPTDCSLSLGHQLIIQPLFLSDMDAVNYFKDPTQKEYVKTILSQMKIQKLTYNEIPESPPHLQDLSTYYELNYDPIANMNCAYLLKMHFPVNGQNNFLINISNILFLHNLKMNFYFFVWKYASFFGSFPVAFAILIVFLGACYSILNRPTVKNMEQIFVIAGLILVILNNAMLALIAGEVTRYLFYNYFIYYCLAALAADRVFIKPIRLLKKM